MLERDIQGCRENRLKRPLSQVDYTDDLYYYSTSVVVSKHSKLSDNKRKIVRHNCSLVIRPHAMPLNHYFILLISLLLLYTSDIIISYLYMSRCTYRLRLHELMFFIFKLYMHGSETQIGSAQSFSC